MRRNYSKHHKNNQVIKSAEITNKRSMKISLKKSSTFFIYKYNKLLTLQKKQTL